MESQVRGSPLRRILRSALLVAAILASIGWTVWWSLPLPTAWAVRNPDRTSFMAYRVQQAKAAGEPLDLEHRWLPLDSIAPVMRRAVVVAEDGRFFEHRGIDWLALAQETNYGGDDDFSWLEAADRAALMEAIRYALDHREELRGRSTITQQLAKNLYFTPDRSLSRKLAEFFVARRLERFLTKDRILELYLNTVEFGPGIFGVEAAAQSYFGVSASRLSTWQAATLAATLPHPLTSNPRTRPGRMESNRVRILRYM